MTAPRRRNGVSTMVFVSFLCFVGNLLHRYGYCPRITRMDRRKIKSHHGRHRKQSHKRRTKHRNVLRPFSRPIPLPLVTCHLPLLQMSPWGLASFPAHSLVPCHLIPPATCPLLLVPLAAPRWWSNLSCSLSISLCQRQFLKNQKIPIHSHLHVNPSIKVQSLKQNQPRLAARSSTQTPVDSSRQSSNRASADPRLGKVA